MSKFYVFLGCCVFCVGLILGAYRMGQQDCRLDQAKKDNTTISGTISIINKAQQSSKESSASLGYDAMRKWLYENYTIKD